MKSIHLLIISLECSPAKQEQNIVYSHRVPQMDRDDDFHYVPPNRTHADTYNILCSIQTR